MNDTTFTVNDIVAFVESNKYRTIIKLNATNVRIIFNEEESHLELIVRNDKGHEIVSRISLDSDVQLLTNDLHVLLMRVSDDAAFTIYTRDNMIYELEQYLGDMSTVKKY